MKDMSESEGNVHAVALVIGAIIIAGGLMITGAILTKGDYGTGGCMVDGETAQKAMAMSMESSVELRMGAQTAMQRMKYDHAANTVVMQVPVNFNDSFLSTVAIDYNRELVFISIDGEDRICLASDLYGQMAMKMVRFMTENEEKVIDIEKALTERISYAQAGEIPSGYVSSSNGPIIRGLCQGRVSLWTMETTTQNRRRKRRIGPIRINFCIWRLCFDIGVEYE